LKKNNPIKAVYFLKWGMSLSEHGTAAERSFRKHDLERNLKKLNAAQNAYLNGLEITYSFKKLEQFEKITNNDLDRIEELKAAEAKKLYEDSSKSIIELDPESGITTLPEEGLSIWFPEKPLKVMEAYGGKFILAYLPENKKIAVIDTIKARFIKFLDFNSKQFSWAAGGHNLAIYDKEGHTLHIIDMKAWKVALSYKVPGTSKLNNIYMRTNDGSKVLLDFATPNLNERFKYFFPKTKKILNLSVEKKFTKNTYYSSHYYNRLNKYMTISSKDNRLMFRDSSGYLSARIGLNSIYLEWHDMKEPAMILMKALNPLINENGQFVFNNHGLYNVKSKSVVSSFNQLGYTKRTVGRLFGSNGLVVHGVKDSSAFLKVLSIPSLNEIAHVDIDSKLDGSSPFLFASAYAERMGILSHKNHKKFTLYNFNKQIKVVADLPAPGNLYRQKIELDKSTNPQLESGPEGAKLDLTKGELVWEIPENQERGKEATFIIGYTKKDGEQDYKLIKIYIP